MTETLSRASNKAGLPPGSLVHIGEVPETGVRITTVDYNKDIIEEHSIESIDQILQYRVKDTVTWVNIEGLANVDLIGAIGEEFNIHPLVLEDILNTQQRPKLEEYDDYLYCVLKGISLGGDGFSVFYEQISILILDNFLFTFKEKQDEIFEPVKRRLRSSKGHFRSQGADYLAYVILDTIVDSYFTLQDSLDDIVDSVEEELLTNSTAETLATIQGVKRELIFIRRSISPLREMLNAILRSESHLIQEKTLIYFRDISDHVLRISESIESSRDMVAGLLDIYITSISNKMNEIMKVLTVFASIFIPLTFIAGIYGMNFDYMPELKWKWAYPALWVSFITIPMILLVYFKKKKWL
jgi:magnesium transporter